MDILKVLRKLRNNKSRGKQDQDREGHLGGDEQLSPVRSRRRPMLPVGRAL